jgi:hypothetical protein
MIIFRNTRKQLLRRRIQQEHWGRRVQKEHSKYGKIKNS